MNYLAVIKKYYKKIQPVIRKYYTFIKKNSFKLFQKLKKQLTSWWRVIVAVVFTIVFLYYPLGGWLINDTSTPSFQPENSKSLSTIDSLNFLINQEVHHKIWTPNLPIMFPSYFLDNMPNFQLGVLSAVGNTASALNKFSFNTVSSTAHEDLNKASELLQYPGTIWLFSPQNSLMPATSSSTQYKKGRRLLKNFNSSIAEGKTNIPLDEANFIITLKYIKKDLSSLVKNTSSHIRENQDSWLDFKSDDVFYDGFGKIYAYAQITKGLGHDFKDILVKHDIYGTWSSLLKILDETSSFEPWIVRNGKFQSSFTPNHLLVLGYQASRAVNYLNIIINKLP